MTTTGSSYEFIVSYLQIIFILFVAFVDKFTFTFLMTLSHYGCDGRQLYWLKFMDFLCEVYIYRFLMK